MKKIKNFVLTDNSNGDKTKIQNKQENIFGSTINLLPSSVKNSHKQSIKKHFFKSEKEENKQNYKHQSQRISINENKGRIIIKLKRQNSKQSQSTASKVSRSSRLDLLSKKKSQQKQFRNKNISKNYLKIQIEQILKSIQNGQDQKKSAFMMIELIKKFINGEEGQILATTLHYLIQCLMISKEEIYSDLSKLKSQLYKRECYIKQVEQQLTNLRNQQIYYKNQIKKFKKNLNKIDFQWKKSDTGALADDSLVNDSQESSFAFLDKSLGSLMTNMKEEKFYAPVDIIPKLKLDSAILQQKRRLQLNEQGKM